jgi:hypothetical protein
VNLSRFDLMSIRLGLYCVQTGSLSPTARLCHLALAAASRRIRELEDALGLALGIGVSTEAPAVVLMTRILFAPSQNAKSHPLRKQ